MYRQSIEFEDDHGTSPFRLLSVRHLRSLRLVCSLLNACALQIVFGRTGPSINAVAPPNPRAFYMDQHPEDIGMVWLASDPRARHIERLTLEVPCRGVSANDAHQPSRPCRREPKSCLAEQQWAPAYVTYDWQKLTYQNQCDLWRRSHALDGRIAAASFPRVLVNCRGLKALSLSSSNVPHPCSRPNDAGRAALGIWVSTLLSASKYMASLRMLEIRNDTHFFLISIFEEFKKTRGHWGFWRWRLGELATPQSMLSYGACHCSTKAL